MFWLFPYMDVIRRSFLGAVNGVFVGFMNYQMIFSNQAFLLAGKNTLRFFGICIPLLAVSYTHLDVYKRQVQVSVGDWVDIQLEQQAQSTDGIVLSKAFVRTEDGVSYVYKDDNGVLKKQIVKVKENVNGGAYVLVSGGLSMDDKIAFPYSKSIKEGMKTKEGSLATFMGYDSTSYGGLG